MIGDLSNIQKIGKKSIVQKIIDILTQWIISGELRPGDTLPSEPELARAFGVARTSVREAIKVLEYMGILQSQVRSGTRVVDGFQNRMIDPMVYGIILHSHEDKSNLLELRHMTEVGIVELAIQHKDEAGMARLLKALEAMENASSHAETAEEQIELHFEADNHFHEVLASLARNPIAEKINQVVRDLTFGMRHETVTQIILRNRLKEHLQSHRDIYDIIKEENVEGLNETIWKTYYLELLS